jgi:predicted GIY-YIG superfamily endonuclease
MTTIPITSEEWDRRIAAVGARFLEPVPQGSHKTHAAQCNTCGHIWDAKLPSVTHGCRCPKCTGRGYSSTVDQTQRNIEAAAIDCCWLELCGDSRTKKWIQCLICNHKWKAAPNRIRNGVGCPECSRRGFSSNRPGFVYLLTDSRGAAKIGVTHTKYDHSNGRIAKLSKEGWKLVAVWSFDVGQFALNVESAILRWWRKELNLPPAYEGIDGWTETVDTRHVSLVKIIQKIESLCLV